MDDSGGGGQWAVQLPRKHVEKIKVDTAAGAVRRWSILVYTKSACVLVYAVKNGFDVIQSNRSAGWIHVRPLRTMMGMIRVM